ncbi:allophanate hydrolase [Sporothrix schenckii 1099-18]|uniref:Allophanate hydrolase n=2 Tax=Sporothrix schenckii TaxID=29908 RepID=U7PIL9_SPOS1|nr:allophanate hydrolase [Sporothrix schenckii 1099-18]ERS95458.1 allophanate hydrolase [Sporothrix schenckii ATCC 58251]KJR86850.1 allophanate hydrolase [Sporothrix schenckii 1099-18]
MDELTFATARPYAFSFVRAHTALVLIDLQRDFVDPGGFGAIQCGSSEIFAGVRKVVPATLPVLAAARKLGLHIVHTREGHRPDLADLSAAKRNRQLDAPGTQHTAGIGDKGPMGRLLVRGEHGHDFVDELRPRPDEIVVDKPGKGAFWATSMHRQLMARGVTHLLFCGVTTECCVASTAREASDRGFQCCILEDCTGGFEASFATASVDMYVSFGGLFGFAAPSTELVVYAKAETGKTESLSTPQVPWDGKSLDLTTLQAYYKRSALSPIEIVNAVYDHIEAYEKENPHVWILLRPRGDVIEDAQALQDKYAAIGRDSLPPLYGVPFAVKDSFDIKGMNTTAACPDFAYLATETAPTVTSILDAGALLIGKTNMDQLATGLSGCRSPYGVSSSVFSPADMKYCSGGSSSGSAVAVGAHLVTFSLATDTAGSGRVPASFNGIVGYKPTKGTLSYRGIVPCCRSIDTATILAQSVADARRIWHIVDQYDDQDIFAKDPQSLPLTLADYRGIQKAGFTCAVPPNSALAVASCSPAYQAAFTAALQVVRRIGGRLRTLSDTAYQPFMTATDLLYNGTLVNERIACMGVDFVRDHITNFHPTTKTLFEQVLERDSKPWDVYGDQLVQATATQQAGRLLSGGQGSLGGVGAGSGGESSVVDVLVVPTAPFHPTIAEMQADPIALNAKLGVFTHFGNVLDLCAMSVNAGFVEDGMPFGVCFVCARGMDGRLFDIASEFERAVAATK